MIGAFLEFKRAEGSAFICKKPKSERTLSRLVRDAREQVMVRTLEYCPRDRLCTISAVRAMLRVMADEQHGSSNSVQR